MNERLLEAVACVSRSEFDSALALLPMTVTAEEDWVRVVCLHVLDRVGEIANAVGGVPLYTTTEPPVPLREALLSAHARSPQPFTVSLVASSLPQGEQRAFLEAALPKKLKRKTWHVDDQGAVVGELIGVLVREGDVQGVETLLNLFEDVDDFSGPWVRGLTLVYAALHDPNQLDEALRQVQSEIPSLGGDYEVLIAVLIQRAEALGQQETAADIWTILLESLRKDLEDQSEDAPGPPLPEPEDREIELMFIADNQEIDVIARLPGLQALDFLRQAAGEVHRPELERLTAFLALRVLTTKTTPEWKAEQLAHLTQLLMQAE